MTERVHQLTGAATVALYGYNHSSAPRTLATLHNAGLGSICFIEAPGSAQGYGYQTIVKPVFGQVFKSKPDVLAEGIVLTNKYSAAVMKTSDSPVLVLYEANQGRLLVTSAGRAAMTPTNKPGGPVKNIITIGFKALVNGCRNPELHAYITGAICGSCFTHDQPGDEEYIIPFDQFGKFAFKNREKGALDLTAVIISQLVRLGVPASRIRNDGLCTKETTWLASSQKNKRNHNLVVVVLR